MSKEEQKITINLSTIRVGSPQFILALVVIVFLSVFGYWYKYKRPYLTLQEAKLEAYAATIYSDSSGRISLMGPEEGDFIKRGEKLFTLENKELLAKRQKAKESVDRLEKRLEIEKAQVEGAMQTYLSMTNNSDSIAPDSVQKHIDRIEQGQIKTDELDKEIAKAKKFLDYVNQEFKNQYFSAPFTGTVLKCSKNPGSVISFGEPLYVLCDMSKLWIETEIKEKDLGKIAVGNPARIKLSAYPKKVFKGEITYIGPATTQKSSIEPMIAENQTIPIKISIETQNLLLKPGLSATVDLKVR